MLLTSLFGFIQVFAEDPSCWPYFEPTRFKDILAIFITMQEDDIKFMSIYTLSLLVEMIPLAEQSVLVFEEKLIREYIGIFALAVSSPDLNAMKVFGSLVIPADDLLRMIKQLWNIKPNKNTISSYLASLISPIEMCLKKGNEIQQRAAMDLMWTFISDSDIWSQIAVGDICIDYQLLEKLASSSSDSTDSVGAMASCVLYKLHPEFVSGKWMYRKVCIVCANAAVVSLH